MAITFCESTGVFQLDTAHSTYQFQADRFGVLMHLYYGKKLTGDMRYLIQPFDVGFSGNPVDAGEDRTYSLDTLPQEFPSCGIGDYRISCTGILNGDGSRAVDFRYVSHRVEAGCRKITGMPALHAGEGQAETLSVTLRDLSSGVEAVLYYTVLETEDMIGRCVQFKNGGKETVVLDKALSSCLDLPCGDWELVHFHGRHAMERMMERVPLVHGSICVGSRRGTSSHQHNPALILCEESATEVSGSCYGLALVYSGNFLAEVEVDQLEQVRTVIGIHPEQFRYVLEAGASFETPQVMMAYTDEGFGGMTHLFHRAIRSHICRGRFQDARRPVLINSWEAMYFDCTRTKVLDLAKKAAELGMEMLVLDDGWYGKRERDNAGLGDWYVNEEKMGGSIKSLVEEINALGLKFGIWVEPEMISEDSDLYRVHPDWALQIPGREPNRARSQLVLDLSRADVRDYLFERLSELLSGSNIEYVKWDMNRSMCDIYSALQDCCHQGEVYHRCVLGVYELLERVVSAFPDVLLEGCSGGGGRFDPAMLYYSPQYWCSDDTDAIERLEIQYGTSFFYPVSSVGAHVSASPNHQTGRRTPLSTRGVVAMAGTFGYELDLQELTAQEECQVRGQIEDYKRFSDVIQNGRYYRLTSPYNKQYITSWQMVSEDKRKSLVSLVCTHVRANKKNVLIKLRGLDASMEYEIEGMDGRYSGGSLMYGGLALPLLQGEYPSRQLFLTGISK